MTWLNPNVSTEKFLMSSTVRTVIIGVTRPAAD
jgi:hypothetical protein